MRTHFPLAAIAAAKAGQTAPLGCSGVLQWGEQRSARAFRTGPAEGWRAVRARLMTEAPLPPRAMEAGVSRRTWKVKAAAGPDFTAIELPPAMAEDLSKKQPPQRSRRGGKNAGRANFPTVEAKQP